MKKITIADDEAYLRQISKQVVLEDLNLKKEIEDLRNFCKANTVLAMAAVQIGIPKRIIYLKNTNLEMISRPDSEKIVYDEERVLINPIIIKREGITDYWEACASCLNNMGHVRRPYKMIVEYLDQNGKKHCDTFEGFEATVLGHEMDHLDGILHIDIADEILVMEPEERKKFRETHGYNIISKIGDFEELFKSEKQKIIKR